MTSIEELSLAFPSPDAAGSNADPTGLIEAQAAAQVETLVETHAALLFRVAHSILRSRSEAEDVVQDTFLRVLEHHRKLPAVRDTRVWLIRIAWNLALDRRRRIRPDQMDELFAQSLVARTLPADQALDEAQRMNAVLRELEHLPKAERHILLLAAIEELTNTEMAQVLGKTESAIRALLFRARTRLRQRIEKSQRLEKGGHA
jgi:RNA polymerase sigma-70 factor (ECF subfamily)